MRCLMYGFLGSTGLLLLFLLPLKPAAGASSFSILRLRNAYGFRSLNPVARGGVGVRWYKVVGTVDCS